MPAARRFLRWWRAPLWLFALFTGAKSFADNPILGSRRLNRAGLHVQRKRLAQMLARWRRSRLARDIPVDVREQFDRDGFVVIPDFLPDEDFRLLQSALLDGAFECREHQQGDTLTRRIAVGPALLARVPQLATLLDSQRWKGITAYVAATRSAPLYYIQTIAGGVAEGPRDPQLELHSDTFHPSLKAWLFLTDVPDDGRPLTYVAGSHLLSPERADWEQRRSSTLLADGDRLSQRGSLRISASELPALRLPPPTRFSVPANTLVAIDTCGFHARADSDRPTLRVELWAYSRRAEWFGAIVDRLAKRGLMVQHWRRAGPRRPIEP